MYKRIETITSINGDFKPFISTLSDDQKVLFLSVIESNLISISNSYAISPGHSGQSMESLWSTKEEFVAARDKTNAEIKAAIGTTPDEYYANKALFEVTSFEEEI